MLLSIGAQSATRDYLLERAYFEDVEGKLKLADVQDAPFTSYQGLLSKGYSQSAFWVRLKIDGTPKLAANGERLIMRIEPTYLDEIALFDPLEPNKTERYVGDRHSWNDYEYKTMVFNFVIPAAEKPRYVWIRLKTKSTSMMLVRVFSEPDEIKIDHQYETISLLLFASILMFILWAMANWVTSRDRLIGIFAIKQIFGLLFVGSYIGLFRIFFSDDISASNLDYLNSAFVLSTTFTTIWFHYNFFADYELKPAWRRSFQLMLFAIPLSLLFIVAGKLSSGLAVNMIVVLALGPFMFGLSILGIDWVKTGLKPSALPRRVVILFHILFAIVSSITALPSLGFVALTKLAPHFVMIHGFLTGVIMIVMLQHRTRVMFEESQLKASMAEQDALNEKNQRAEERRFLEMLTHEIRTSLSVIRMTIGMGTLNDKQRRHVDNAIMGMSQVIERCQQVQEAHDGKLLLNADRVELVELIQSIVHDTGCVDRIQMTLPPECSINSDEKLLRVVITNLIDNALKYGAESVPVEVVVMHKSHKLNVLVTNAVGPVGIPDATKVFEKYYRASRAHGYIGSGLGLYLIKNIARLLGADLVYLPDSQKVKFQLTLVVA